jgi:hypothetical protein
MAGRIALLGALLLATSPPDLWGAGLVAKDLPASLGRRGRGEVGAVSSVGEPTTGRVGVRQARRRDPCDNESGGLCAPNA